MATATGVSFLLTTLRKVSRFLISAVNVTTLC